VDPLTEAFSVPGVKGFADPGSYQRGVAYSGQGLVSAARDTGRGFRATVQGTMPYSVELWIEEGEPRWSCTCPAAENGSFCKHCVAVALTLNPDEPAAGLPRSAERLARLQRSSRAPGRQGADRDPHPDSAAAEAHLLAEFVDGLPRERLARIVLDRATSDWRLRERLLAEARAGRGEGPDLPEWRNRIDGALAPHRGFVVYREARGWAEGVGEVIDAVEDLCVAGHPDAAALLAEHAYRRVEEAVGYVDDSDGWLSVIAERLGDVHLRACEEGRPDPVALAGRLVDLELDSELEVFGRTAAVYAEVLGQAGLAAFRETLDSRREQIDAAPGSPGRGVSDYALHRATVGWALATGDPDTLIEVHVGRGDGRITAAVALEIVQALEAAGRRDEALRWAERGLVESAHRFWPTRDLRGWLAARLRERGDAGAAVGLYWDAFRSDPALESYRCLLDEVEQAPGVREEWSRRCVAELRARVAGEESEGAASARRVGSDTAEVLVRILLFKGLLDNAWNAALAFGCRHETWMTLARAREKTHPLDAIDVYEPEVLALIDQKKTSCYEVAVDLMDRILRLANSAGEPERFGGLLERVRTEHRAKRNLKKLLDSKGW
jgi:tetratricopeptide (TPR) repeat protein